MSEQTSELFAGPLSTDARTQYNAVISSGQQFRMGCRRQDIRSSSSSHHSAATSRQRSSTSSLQGRDLDLASTCQANSHSAETCQGRSLAKVWRRFGEGTGQQRRVHQLRQVAVLCLTKTQLPGQPPVPSLGLAFPFRCTLVPRRNPCLARDATRRNRWTHNRCEFSHLSLSAGMDQFSEDLRHGRFKNAPMFLRFSRLPPHGRCFYPSSCSISSSIRLAHHMTS